MQIPFRGQGADLEAGSCWLLVYAIAIIFQLHYGGDMMYEMRKRNPKPTLLLTPGIFNCIGTGFDDVSYKQWVHSL